MSKFPIEFLKHIRDEIIYLTDTTDGLTEDKFMYDRTLQRSFSRSLEVIGEATKQLTSEFKQEHPDVDWKAMAGMRDRLIHGYFEVDYAIVWDVVVNEIPQLKNQIETILTSNS